MSKTMLIDASHREETRVVVVNDRQLEEFDFESSTKRQLKGNIYLAKVTRVEPSLQACFVDYGGLRHGFLAFSEIHPDYYQIPQADREMLEKARLAEVEQQQQIEVEPAAEDGAEPELAAEAEAITTDAEEEAAEDFAEQARRRQRLLRNYKIQEVIKRRQILLVQVVKEERGNKGAALTTYLSLAGRYCVLMPNTARGGGISRKIANMKDRARLKAIARELEVPQGMGLIVRTAGQSRNKLEIRRDYDYLLRLWSDIRDRTLQSIAPCTIHEEGALVKRAIRDIYDSDIDEILVEGDEGYKSAKKVMSMLMPSRARKVKQYREELPLFHHFQIEQQLDALHSPVVELRSGGSIVINPTEALTAIDVNSGRSTRERNIEETAVKTNCEAAEEIARQLRLRDLAGLVVIDFIDMTEMRNQRTVERRLRDALRFDRARIQLGRISAFGLLELSRQRLRPSLLELSTQPCPVCAGSGAIRSVESAALQALRAVELEGMKGQSQVLAVTLPGPVALYLLNQKRDQVVSLEQRYDMKVEVKVDNGLIAGQLRIETLEIRADDVVVEEVSIEPAAAQPRVAAAKPVVEQPASAAPIEDDGQRKRRRRRRRRRRGGDGEVEMQDVETTAAAQHDEEDAAFEPVGSVAISEAGDAAGAPQHDAAPEVLEPPLEPESELAAAAAGADMPADEAEAPRSRRRRRTSTRSRRRGAVGRSAGAEEQPVIDEQPLVDAVTTAIEERPVADDLRADEVAPAILENGQLTDAPVDDDPTEVGPGDRQDDGAQTREDEVQEASPTPAPIPAAAAEAPVDVAEEPAAEANDDHGHDDGNGVQATPSDETSDDDDDVTDGNAGHGDVPFAVVDSDHAEPRRGWWNRFVRKQE